MWNIKLLISILSHYSYSKQWSCCQRTL